MNHFVRLDRRRQQEALRLITLLVTQKFELLPGLDAFSDEPFAHMRGSRSSI